MRMETPSACDVESYGEYVLKFGDRKAPLILPKLGTKKGPNPSHLQSKSHCSFFYGGKKIYKRTFLSLTTLLHTPCIHAFYQQTMACCQATGKANCLNIRLTLTSSVTVSGVRKKTLRRRATTAPKKEDK